MSSTTPPTVVVFRSTKSARLRVKVAEALIQGYRADGKAIYSNKAVYAVFENMVCILDSEIPEQQFIIEKLRKHVAYGADFKEVIDGETPAKNGNKVMKFSKMTLDAMQKSELIALAKNLGLDASEELDTKASLVKALLDEYQKV